MNACLDPEADRLDAIVSVSDDRKIKESFDRDVKLDISTAELEYEHEMFTATIATYEFDLRGGWGTSKRRIHALDKDIRTDVAESVDETAFLTTVTLFTKCKRKREGLSVGVSCKKKAKIVEDELRKRIESNHIDWDAFVADDFDAYFKARAMALLDTIEAAVGKSVADRGTEETIKRFGCSLEKENV